MRRALVLGGASCVWDDAAEALDLFTPDLTIAVNDMIGAWSGRLDIAATLHPERLHTWLGKRRARGYEPPKETWAHKVAGPRGRIEAHIDRVTDDWSGSSGLFGVKIALECGCDRVVLAGVPMSSEGAHFFDGREWVDARSFHAGWLKHRDEIAPYVRSCSGWTAELLGRPDKQWLHGAA